MILLQKGKTLTRRDDDFSARRFKLAGQNLEERRFSGAVCTDQTVAAALCEFDVDIFKESFFSYNVREGNRSYLKYDRGNCISGD